MGVHHWLQSQCVQAWPLTLGLTGMEEAVSMPLNSHICRNGSAHTVCLLGVVCECLNYSLELCGGVFLGPCQQFSLCLDLAMSSALHAATETVRCMFCCASRERTRRKRMWLDLALIQSCSSGSLPMLDTIMVKTPNQLLVPHPQQESPWGKQQQSE